ncbi:MAG: stage II sporulation protein P [Bacillota bacterium]
MISIRVIEVRKILRYFPLLLTILLMIISFRVITTEDVNMIAKAHGMEGQSAFMLVKQDTRIRDNFFIYVLNKTLPIMEVNYHKQYGSVNYTGILKYAINSLVNFDYDDPKTLLQAQMPILKSNEEYAFDPYTTEMNDDFYEDHDTTSFQQEISDANQEVPIPEPIQETPGQDTSADSEPVSQVEQSNDIPGMVEGVEIVSSSISVRMPNKVKLDLGKPVIFVYHTHATESYRPHTEGNFRSLEKKYTVRAVGDKLTEYLENKGYKVIHDEMIHDYPSYNESYIRSLETLKRNLKENSSLKIIFDIHRDAFANPVDEELVKNSTVTINGEKVAKFSLVVGGKNENVAELQRFAEYVKAKSDELYPGLAKATIIKDYAKFNQYNSDYYALVEVGSTANDINEAIRTTKYLAQIIDLTIKDIRE